MIALGSFQMPSNAKTNIMIVATPSHHFWHNLNQGDHTR
jgi:hypothetical protein